MAIVKLASGFLRWAVVLIIVELSVSAGLWWEGFFDGFQRDPITGWSMQPDVQLVFRGEKDHYLVEINSAGFRDDEHEPDEETYRIVILGSCVTFGLGTRESDSYAKLIEEFLPGTETINLACVAHSADQQFVVLNRDGFRYKPDLVVQFLSTHDAKVTFRSWIPWLGPKSHLEIGKNEVVIQPLSDNFIWREMVSWSHLWFSISSLLPNDSHISLFSAPLPEPVERYKALGVFVLQTRDLCRSRGIDYVAMNMVDAQRVRIIGEHGEGGTSLVSRLLRYLQTAEELPVLDLAPVLLEAVQDPDQPSPFSKDGHCLSRTGNRMVGECVAKFLAQRNSVELTFADDSRSRLAGRSKRAE